LIAAFGLRLASCLNVGSSSSRSRARKAVGASSMMIVQYA
jgi:hypothetical protein